MLAASLWPLGSPRVPSPRRQGWKLGSCSGFVSVVWSSSKESVHDGLQLGIDLAIVGDHVAGVLDEQGRHVRQIRFERTFQGYEKFHRALQQLPTEHGQPWIVLTPTGNAWVPLATYLKAKGYYVLTVSPQQEYDLRQYYKKHAKSDRIDAFVLASVPRVDPDGVHELVLPEALVDSLRRWTREREDLVGHATACWQRVLAILQQTAPTLAQAWGASLRTQAGQAFSSATLILRRS